MKKLLEMGLGPKIPYPRNSPIHKVFEDIALKFPKHMALSSSEGKMTYKELNEKANQIGHHLIGLGVKKGDLVGISLERSLNLVAGVLGILKAGAAYVPIDQSYPLERKLMMIEDAGLKILITQASLYGKFPQGKLRLFCLDAEGFIEEKKSNIDLPVGPLDLAYINYTSGSTGKPKGVEVCHRGVVRHVVNTNWIDFSPKDCMLNMANISFDATTTEIWGALLNGASLAIYPQQEFTPELIGAFLVNEKVTHAIFTARLFNILVEHQLDSLKGLRYIASVGEAMSVFHAKRAFNALPKCKVVNGYGPTENTACTTFYLIRDLKDIEQVVPIGRPISNTDVYILDSDQKLVDIGVSGELFTGGDGVARGYLNRPDLTAEKFIPNPFGEGRLYRTGDLVHYLSDGNIVFDGRIDTQVKIRGFRIELGEIEEVIRHHPSVADCAVIAREDAPGDKRLVAYVEPRKEVAISADTLREYAASILPKHMIPSFFVVMEKFPLSPTGKVDRKAFPPPILESKEKVSYKTATENAIADIWSEVLHLDHIAPHDHFVKIGGDSISAMEINSRIKKELKIESSVHMLFDYPVFIDFISHVQIQKHIVKGKIAKRKVFSPIPQSLNQESLWLIDQLYPLSPLYLIVSAFRFKGKYDLKKLKKSLAKMVDRHEILRTRFTEGKQLIEKKGTEAFVEVDLSKEKKPEELALALIQKQANIGMDLSQLPLLQIVMIKVKNDLYFGLLKVHHIIFDGWSTGPFFKEWLSLKSFPPLPNQYGDYSVWQREFLETDEARLHIEYWRKQLQGAPELLELPWDKPRPAQFSGKGQTVQLKLPKELTVSLNQTAKQQGVTLFVLTLAAFKTLLYRYSGKEDILIGTPYANRNRPELHDLIGFFVQMLVIRSDLSGNPNFSHFLQKVNQTVSTAFKNGDIPFEKIVAELNPHRNPSYNPIFQVGFTLENIVEFAGEPIHLENMTSKFDLDMTLREKGNDLICAIDYCSDLFEKKTIERMLIHFKTLLESIVQNPNERIGFLPILTSQEIHQITVEWNDQVTPYPKNRSIVSLFEEIAAQFPDHIALSFKHLKMSYSELNKQANQLAHHLKKLGVKRQEFVGIYLERSLDLIIGILAILKIGAVYVPIDAGYPMERKLFMIEDTKLHVLLTQKSLAQKFPKANLHFLCLDEEREMDSSSENLNTEIDPLDLAYINYTSGSTGKPKGVAVCHRGVIRLVKNTNWVEIQPLDRFSQISNISFDAVTYEIWGALLNAATLCIYPHKKLSTEELGKFLVEEKISHLDIPSRLFTLMVEERLDCLKGLKVITPGGDVLSPFHAKIAAQALIAGEVINTYGPTENTTLTTAYPIHDLREIENNVPIGRPISNSTVFILDRNNQLVPVGVHGELCTGGDGLARGYLNQKEMTEKKFIPNPFGQGRIYKTGDLVKYLPDGNIAFLGRMDHQVKIRGFRIELGEIEDILRHHIHVSDCVALAREDIPGEKILVAYIEPKEGTTISIEEIRTYSAEKLPQYMLPSFFIILEKFPVAPTGKIDRKALPSPTNALEKRDFEAPVTTTEKIMADIWSKILKIPKIGRKDQFFQLGGHSIAAAQLSAFVNKAFECKVPVNLIFEESQLDNYAKKIDQILSQGDQKVPITSSELFWVWRNREVILDSSIHPEGAPPKASQYTSPKKIFLTGATGFVGAFFLRDLLEKTKAKIYCQIRAETKKEAMARLQIILKNYLIWKPAYISRIIPVPGDLEKKNLGMADFDLLASEIDSVFHFGAYVNHALPYPKLKAANVGGTQEVIRFACKTKTKPLHFISTVAVIEPKGDKPIDEGTNLNDSKNLINGYAQSKWVGEKLVLIARSRGLPTSIYRLSRVSGDSRNGAGPTTDFLWRVVHASIRLKMAPQINYSEEVTPVNFVTEAIQKISLNPNEMNQEYHVFNPKSFSYKDIFKILIDFGYPIKMTDFLNWRRTLVQMAMDGGDNELKAIVPLFAEVDLSEAHKSTLFSFENTVKALKGSKIKCPKVDKKLFEKYIKYYIKIGFLPP